MDSCLFISKNYYNYAGKYEKLLFLSNMQIISLNMHDTKMAQAKINSMEKIGLGTKKLLVPKFIELLWEYPCLLWDGGRPPATAFTTPACCSINTGSKARYAYPTCIRHPSWGGGSPFPLEYCHPVWCGKTRMVWLPHSEKIEDIFIRFETNVTDTHHMTA